MDAIKIVITILQLLCGLVIIAAVLIQSGKHAGLSGISDLKRLIKTAETFQAKLAVCVNKWDVSPENTNAIRDFCQSENIPFVGKIPYDKSASRAINEGISIADIDCPARDALKEIYEAVCKLLEL